jgi:hypothetical protein
MKTFIDAGVLIAAFRGSEPESARAFGILDDPGREFASSIFVKTELLPKAVYHARQRAVEFYEAFFTSVVHRADFNQDLIREAFEEATLCGLGALDALHVVGAGSIGADQLVTTERESKPIHRTKLITVISIRR